MKLLWGHKDGGPESNVRMWGIEIKGLCSILVLCFSYGSRDAYHNHAFNSISWLLKGRLWEEMWGTGEKIQYDPSRRPIYTGRNRMHKVHGVHLRNWVLTLRGPWKNVWNERRKQSDGPVSLTHGRKVLP